MKKMFCCLLMITFPLFLFGQKDSITRLNYVTLLKTRNLPLTTWSITKDKQFWDNLKIRALNIDFLRHSIIRGSDELGVFYKREAMDNPQIILTGYQKYDYYGYCLLDGVNYTYMVYVFKNEDNIKYYLAVLNKKGMLKTRFLLYEEVVDKYFCESIIIDNFRIKQVKYSYKTENESAITENDYLFDLITENFELIKTINHKAGKFYYEYKKHNLEEDPLIPATPNN